jgi:hypothetical protein
LRGVRFDMRREVNSRRRTLESLKFTGAGSMYNYMKSC